MAMLPYEVAIALLVGLEAATLYWAVAISRLNRRLVAELKDRNRRSAEITKTDIKPLKIPPRPP